MPCTANGRSRIITKVLISPHTMPSTTPAMSELCTSAQQLAVVAEVEDAVPADAAVDVTARRDRARGRARACPARRRR